jgi:hypothetical protein
MANHTLDDNKICVKVASQEEYEHNGGLVSLRGLSEDGEGTRHAFPDEMEIGCTDPEREKRMREIIKKLREEPTDEAGEDGKRAKKPKLESESVDKEIIVDVDDVDEVVTDVDEAEDMIDEVKTPKLENESVDKEIIVDVDDIVTDVDEFSEVQSQVKNPIHEI